jgi:protein-L-isoaspartate(D-aspartate) O-methyltransferase
MREDSERTRPTPATVDDSRAAALRAGMVAHLRAEGCGGVLRDPAVAQAMEKVPRHLFVPDVPVDEAYADIAIPTHFEDGVPTSSASQPAIVALMLQQLQPFAGMHVLEIGAGTGYNAALLAELAGPVGAVTTVDITPEVAAEARAHLDAAGYQTVEVVTDDGALGWPPSAPYDRIELTVGASDISPTWAAQLRDEGLLALPLWLGAADACVALRKHGDGFTSESLVYCGFMRLRGAESDARRWLTLSGGWRLASEHADHLAPTITALLATRPHHRLWPWPISAIPGFAQYLALQGLDVVTLWPPPKSKRQVRPRFGLYADGPSGPSLCLIGAMLPVLHLYGGSAAEATLEAEWQRWQNVRMLPLESWQVTAYPRDAAPSAPQTAGAVRHTRRHYVFDIAFLDTLP